MAFKVSTPIPKSCNVHEPISLFSHNLGIVLYDGCCYSFFDNHYCLAAEHAGRTGSECSMHVSV